MAARLGEDIPDLRLRLAVVRGGELGPVYNEDRGARRGRDRAR